MNMDLKPGRVVEYGSELYLVEEVEVTVTMQKLDRLAPQIARAEILDWANMPVHSPVFVRLNGVLDDPESPISRLLPLYKETEL